jgi:hypothetical protein
MFGDLLHPRLQFVAADPVPVTSRSGTAFAKPRFRLAVNRRTGQAILESATSSDSQAGTGHPANGRQLAISGRLELEEPKEHDGNRPLQAYQPAQLLAGKPTVEHHEQPAIAERAER